MSRHTKEMTMTNGQWQSMTESERYAWETEHRASLVAGSVVQVRATTLSGRPLRDAGNMLTVVRNDGGATVIATDPNGLDVTAEARNLILCVQQPGTITDEQIEALAREANAAGDEYQARLCRAALSGGVDARAKCAAAINAARAQED